MLTAIKRHLDRDEEEGFTLIELMVVVLIIAILLAIAIPTFLGARNSANARAAQSNLRNALTAEQTEWTNTQAFDSTTTDMTGVESGITWANGAAVNTTPNQVSATLGDAGNAILLQAQGKDNNCYWVLQSDDPSNSFTGYAESSNACPAPTAPASPLTTTATGGNATKAANVTVGAPTVYYTSW